MPNTCSDVVVGRRDGLASRWHFQAKPLFGRYGGAGIVSWLLDFRFGREPWPWGISKSKFLTGLVLLLDTRGWSSYYKQDPRQRAIMKLGVHCHVACWSWVLNEWLLRGPRYSSGDTSLTTDPDPDGTRRELQRIFSCTSCIYEGL